MRPVAGPPPRCAACAILRGAILWGGSILGDAVANGGKGTRGILVIVVVLRRVFQLVEVQGVLFPTFVVAVVASTVGIILRLIHIVSIVCQLRQSKWD